MTNPNIFAKLLWDNLEQFAALYISFFVFFLPFERLSRPKISPQNLGARRVFGFFDKRTPAYIHGSAAVRLAYLYMYILLHLLNCSCSFTPDIAFNVYSQAVCALRTYSRIALYSHIFKMVEVDFCLSLKARTYEIDSYTINSFDKDVIFWKHC